MNLKDVYIGVNEYVSPRIIGEVNDQYIKIAKIKGQEIPRHNHENELFFIVEGALLIEIENQPNIIMKKECLFVVKKGITIEFLLLKNV